jgi:hypothetical protein
MPMGVSFTDCHAFRSAAETGSNHPVLPAMAGLQVKNKATSNIQSLMLFMLEGINRINSF